MWKLTGMFLQLILACRTGSTSKCVHEHRKIQFLPAEATKLKRSLYVEIRFLSHVMRGQVVIAYEECMLYNKECSFAILMQDHMTCPEDPHAVDEVTWHKSCHLVCSDCPHYHRAHVF